MRFNAKEAKGPHLQGVVGGVLLALERGEGEADAVELLLERADRSLRATRHRGESALSVPVFFRCPSAF